MNTALSTLNHADEVARGAREGHGRKASQFGFRICGGAVGRSGDGIAGTYGSFLPIGMRLVASFLLLAALCMGFAPSAPADWFDDSPPAWEPLLRGGKVEEVEQSQPAPEASPPADRESGEPVQSQPAEKAPEVIDLMAITRITGPTCVSAPYGSAIPKPSLCNADDYYRAPFRVLSLRNIPPLYTSPVLPGEGVWEWKDLPTDANGWPVVYMTSYRPSVEYPNAVVHMLLFDMKRLSMKLFVGSAEPGAPRGSSSIPQEQNHNLIAVTNALWKQRHSDGGTVFRGDVLKGLAPGVATLVVYKDGSVDIVEWNDTVPVSLVQDAKQLRHLILKDGKVVTSIVKNGKLTDSEIGLGYLLAENQSGNGGGGMAWGGYWSSPQPVHTSGNEWFLASRSAFGIRKDGNLVFAVGHHISTKDLAKALALAGCRRAIHGDANPYNVLGNLYYSDGNGGFLKKGKLSPDQSSDSVNRYTGRSYSSDFFGFFLRLGGKGST